MYELFPYFTNDGTVGLFSRQDDDIYHSTYGALTESWQKFIIPSGLEQYIQTHEQVEILDICYGIGYNTKTALNVFINNALNFKKKKKIKKKKEILQIGQENIATIYTDNNKNKLDNKNEKDFYEIFKKNNYSVSKNNIGDVKSIVAIYTNNLLMTQYSENNANIENLRKQENHVDSKTLQNIKECKKISIDAVDLDNFLIDISPFIADASRLNFIFEKKLNDETFSPKHKIKYQQIKNIKNFRGFIKKKFRLRREVSIIILEKLLKQNPNFLQDKILQSILNKKKYFPFFNKFMINLAKIYSTKGYNNNKNMKKSSFLHNIYYRYVSISYKKAQNLLKNNKIDINFYKNDARQFIKTTKRKYNFIFLDAFTPSKCPSLWSLQFFKELHNKLKDDGMILTYSSSAAIRNAFLQNGFFVGKIYDAKHKRFIGTIATKNEDLIEHELNERDIDLINSKAGICFSDEDLELDNATIIKNREQEVNKSELSSSSQVLKGNVHAKSL